MTAFNVHCLFLVFIAAEDLRIFAFITKADKLKDESVRSQKIDDITESFRETLRAPKHRVMKIINFTDDDDYLDATMKYRPNQQKQLFILRAFSKILSGANCQDPFESLESK